MNVLSLLAAAGVTLVVYGIVAGLCRQGQRSTGATRVLFIGLGVSITIACAVLAVAADKGVALGFIIGGVAAPLIDQHRPGRRKRSST